MTPPRSEPAAVEVDDGAEVGPEPAEPEAGRGRGAARPKPKAKPGKKDKDPKIKGRTIYLHDDLFERIIVQAHRKGQTISEYVAGVLGRQVPDYRSPRSGPDDGAGEAG